MKSIRENELHYQQWILTVIDVEMVGIPNWHIVILVCSLDNGSVETYLGRVHPIVLKYTTIFIYICRLNTTYCNDIIADQFRFYKPILKPYTLLGTEEWRVLLIQYIKLYLINMYIVKIYCGIRIFLYVIYSYFGLVSLSLLIVCSL